jgi:hypothetical protein
MLVELLQGATTKLQARALEARAKEAAELDAAIENLERDID